MPCRDHKKAAPAAFLFFYTPSLPRFAARRFPVRFRRFPPVFAVSRPFSPFRRRLASLAAAVSLPRLFPSAPGKGQVRAAEKKRRPGTCIPRPLGPRTPRHLPGTYLADIQSLPENKSADFADLFSVFP